MTVLFIADLHLEQVRPDIADLFFKFLQQQAVHAEALYILGDLFEVWIGDDDASEFNQSIIRAIYRLADQGTAVYFMRGNRDFLIGRKFRRQSACQILGDEHLIQLNGQPTLLMHGDTLCTRDFDYLKFRKKTRNFFVQQLFLLKSLEKRREIARKARQQSYDHTRSTAPEIMDVTQAEVERVMQKYQALQLIHGHTHRPAVHEFQSQGKTLRRTVLAPWHDQGSALLCHDDGRQEFIEIK